MNTIVYSLFLREDSTKEHYSHLHYSLTTLYKIQENYPNFKVFVYVDTDDPGFNFLEYMHLNQFNLMNDFPYVKFFRSDYSKKYKAADPFMAKWYHIGKAFARGAEQVLYLDCDTMYFEDPSYLFEEYNKDYAWVIYEASSLHANPILKRDGINSGQIMLHKSMYDKFDNFFDEVCQKREELSNIAKDMVKQGTMTKEHCRDFCFFNEQYAPQMALVDKGVEFKDFSRENITYGDPYEGIYKVERDIDKDTTKIVKSFSDHPRAILHYTSGAAHIILPFKYHTEFLKNRYKTWLSTGRKRMS